jgi:hypothetical protein
MVIVPERRLLVLATEQVTVPLPEPLPPDRIVIQPTLLTAVQAQ